MEKGVTGTGDGTPTWLTVDSGAGGRRTIVRVDGGIVADRAELLWNAVEEALETGEGRRILLELTRVTGFDTGSIQQLAQMASTASRRHDDICVVLKRHSALDYYVQCHHLTDILPLYYSLADAESTP